ncbi:head-tail joining protein [Paracoccus alkenifer]|uniref:Head-tail adaptor n=1 Tax=Paracoccus alkenifer TaxID=65735 RepID=A0A1H6NHN7_9RHOB|nr:hypothetical protein [Paracoccus alkenifer]SEI10076.1 hypothetical protein SAMN04488075_2866 [Paracoccus alkenifer]
MASIFDGMTGLFTDVFGGSVIYSSAREGWSRVVPSIFREAPIEVEGADGQIVRIETPTWRVPRDQAPRVRRGDRITLQRGQVYEIMVVHPTGSPAPDAFFICECQLVEVP